VIVGSPNVGKSVVFNALTGAYVTVSNYPGTTVELARGRGRIGSRLYDVIDTPGMYSLMPITGEERVARHILLHERPDCVLHVIDAKNASRMLPLTLQLVEAGLPVVVAANMMDEAERMGIVIDTDLLARRLGRAVVPTVATTGRGLSELRREIQLVGDGHNDDR
jgi:ferrous iron transport protein B